MAPASPLRTPLPLERSPTNRTDELWPAPCCCLRLVLRRREGWGSRRRWSVPAGTQQRDETVRNCFIFLSLIVSSHCAVSACVRYWAGLNHGLLCTHKQTLLMEYGPSVVWLGDREAGEQRARQRNTRRTKSSSLSQSPITHACAPAKPEQDKNCRRLCGNKY